MNHINIQQAGGFPMETDTLDAMQTAYNIFNSLGAMNAPLGIITGCEVTGNNVANGVVYINGEVLEFRGGAVASTVIVVEETATRNFENGETKIVYQTRYATFGNSSYNPNYNWSDFHRNVSNQLLTQRSNHIGFIQDFYGEIANIPTGWSLCDGTNGTPDLRSKFIVGYDDREADYNVVGKTGGAKEVALTATQMPKHKHSGTTTTDGAHSHTGLTFEGSNRDNGDPGNLITTAPSESNGNRTQSNAYTGLAGNHNHNFETNDIGGNEPHENRPPYFVLAKIMYTG